MRCLEEVEYGIANVQIEEITKYCRKDIIEIDYEL